MLVVGPPDYDPMQYNLSSPDPPQSITLTNPAWTFFSTPVSLESTSHGNQSGSYNGIASNCMQCSVARMFSIGESGDNGNCYGYCDGATGGDAMWVETVMGELISPCGPSSFGPSNPCAIQWVSNWFPNQLFSSDAVEYWDAPGANDEYVVEGIQDSNYPNPSLRVRTTAANGRLPSPSLPTAPPTACAPDSHGYCSVQASESIVAQCEVGQGPHGPLYVDANRIQYHIYRRLYLLELQENSTETQSFSKPSPTCLPYSVGWSPNNPAVLYNDSSLP
jgi:hypothetical protein